MFLHLQISIKKLDIPHKILRNKEDFQKKISKLILPGVEHLITLWTFLLNLA